MVDADTAVRAVGQIGRKWRRAQGVLQAEPMRVVRQDSALVVELDPLEYTYSRGFDTEGPTTIAEPCQ